MLKLSLKLTLLGNQNQYRVQRHWVNIVWKDFNELIDRFWKPQIKGIRKNLYDIKKPQNISKQKIKEIEVSLFKLEERLFNFKKYRFQDDFIYRNIGDIRN